MYVLTIRDHIAAAHHLEGYDGPCARLHGHTWKIEVTIESEVLNSIGLVMDFRDLKSQLKDLLKEFDHANLNDLSYFEGVNPSSENLARVIFQEFSRRCPSCRLKEVRVYESETAWVSYHEP